VPPDLRAVDLWIGDAADLGRGYGTEMMRLALARCFEQPRVRFVERRRFGRDDCFVYRLDRANHYTCNISGQRRR
jgi:aminoglycoside 6'-N-acetyltransferase